MATQGKATQGKATQGKVTQEKDWTAETKKWGKGINLRTQADQADDFVEFRIHEWKERGMADTELAIEL